MGRTGSPKHLAQISAEPNQGFRRYDGRKIWEVPRDHALQNRGDRALLNSMRRHFPLFSMKAFNVVNPGHDLIPTAAFLAISHKLAEVAQGRIRRLIINVPPRSGKSLMASVALPAFMLGHDPRRRIICASYSGELAAKFTRDCRSLLQHPSYRQSGFLGWTCCCC